MKHGFEVRRDIFLKRGPSPVRLSIMVREPKPPGGGKVAYCTVPSPMAHGKYYHCHHLRVEKAL